MRVLLVHPEDQLPAAGPDKGWDLIVDLGRALPATYERLGEQTGSRVISLYDFAKGLEDRHRLRQLLQLGMGQWMDGSGIDWWDVLSLMIEPDLRQIMLAGRLARELPPGCELYATRSTPLATAVQTFTGAKPVRVEAGFRPVKRWARHYRDFFSQLDAVQMRQVFQDKFDRQHAVRRRLVRRPRNSRHPVVLLPSAYVNVSRTAVSYAALLPNEEFLLVYARNSARLKTQPSNVATASLDSYFVTGQGREAADLAHAWESIRSRLIAGAAEYSAANATGLLDRIPGSIPWGIAVRDAWSQVLQSENVVGCLCADDSNPYTRLPLILAGKRGIPTLACHHGALDAMMAVKTPHADTYIAKGEMERDYLLRCCGVPSEKVVLGGQGLSTGPGPAKVAADPTEAWLVFFTEPYPAAGWRNEEVYGDLLPKLWSLAQVCGLKLVFKVHPFESVKGHRRLLRKYLPREEPGIGVIAGAPSPQLWSNARFAMTVQSTVALQCASLGIPVFLCSWLRDCGSGYAEQFSRFGIGHILEASAELSQVPRLLEMKSHTVQMRPALWETMDPVKLRDLLLRTNTFSEAIKA